MLEFKYCIVSPWNKVCFTRSKSNTECCEWLSTCKDAQTVQSTHAASSFWLLFPTQLLPHVSLDQEDKQRQQQQPSVRLLLITKESYTARDDGEEAKDARQNCRNICAGPVPRQVGVKVGGRGAAAYSITVFQSTAALGSDPLVGVSMRKCGSNSKDHTHDSFRWIM